MVIFFSTPMILLYAILYGATMKIADLLDEHGLKLFKYSNLLFGVLWGLFGALLVLSNPVVANIVLAMNIAFIIRMRIDYLNHAVALTIILITFLFCGSINPVLFLVFYFIFLIFGSLEDIDDVLKRKESLLIRLSGTMFYYPVSALIYCLIYGNWIVFYVFLLYIASYDLTKYYAAKRGYK